MNITYLGHACFLFETSKAKLLFDPFISGNHLASDIDVDGIECDYVFVSHGHEDHIADAERILKRTGATLVSNFEIITWYESKGVENGHPMNIGGNWHFDFGDVKSVNAVHSSGLPDGTYGGNPGGWVIQADGKSIYYAGDTALHYDMKLISEEFDLDLAMLPIGDNFTMGASDAIKASDFVGCNEVIGMHYDTFGYIEVDHDAVRSTFAEKGKNITLMEIGETKHIN